MDPSTLNTVTKGLESSIAATGQLLAKLASRPSPDEAIQLTATVVSVILPGQQGALNTLLNLNQYGGHAHGGCHLQHHHKLTAERDNAIAQANALQHELVKSRAERNDLVSQLRQMERDLELAHRDRTRHQQLSRVPSASSSAALAPLAPAEPSSSHAPTRGREQQQQQQPQHPVNDPYAMPLSGYPTMVPPRPPPALPAVSSSAVVVPPRRTLRPSHSHTSTPHPPSHSQHLAGSTNPSSLGSRASSAPGSPPSLFQDLSMLPPPPGSVTDPKLYSLGPEPATYECISSTTPPPAGNVTLSHPQKRSLGSLFPADSVQADLSSTSTHVNGAGVGEQQDDAANHKRARLARSMAGSDELLTHHAEHPPQSQLTPLPLQPNAIPVLDPVASTSTSFALAAELQQQASLSTSPQSVPRSPSFAAASSQPPQEQAHGDESTSPESLPKIRLLIKPNVPTPSSPPSPSVTMADTSFYSTSGEPHVSFASVNNPSTSESSTAHDTPADPNQLALPTRALSHTILSSMKHFPMRYINGILQLTDSSTRVLAHQLIPITPLAAHTQESEAAKIRKYLAVTNQTLANTSLCLMQVMLARGLGVPIRHSWLLEAIMRTSGSKRSAAMRACHVAWLKPVYIVDEAETEFDVRQALEARFCEETGAHEVPTGARVVVTLGVECVGLESPRADSIPPKLEVREYVLRERWALVLR